MLNEQGAVQAVPGHVGLDPTLPLEDILELVRNGYEEYLDSSQEPRSMKRGNYIRWVVQELGAEWFNHAPHRRAFEREISLIEALQDIANQRDEVRHERQSQEEPP